MRLFAFLLFAAGLQAEYLRVEIDFGGMDCASCSDFVQKKLAKNEAVEEVKVDDKTQTLIVRLHPGNRMKFATIRDLVQQSGYQVKETRVLVVGQAMMDVGRAKLKISENDVLFLKDPETVLRELISRKVGVSGKMERVKTENGMIDILTVTKAEQTK